MTLASAPSSGSTAEGAVDLLIARGVRHVFGVPGGGQSSDVAIAAKIGGIRFILSQTETGAALMAAAQAEITNRPAACVTTFGPGVASVINGVAHARLDRSGLLVIADAPPGPPDEVGAHQYIDQSALLAPLTKGQFFVNRENARDEIGRAFDLAADSPPGPVYVELVSATAAAGAQAAAAARDGPPMAASGDWRQLRSLIARAQRPVALVGLEVRSPGDVQAVRAFCRDLGVPALVTYKAKGVIPDDTPEFGGVVTNGALEAPVLEDADLFIAIGLDPIELVTKAWRYAIPVLDVAQAPHQQSQLPVRGWIEGGLAAGLERISEVLRKSKRPETVHAEARARLESIVSGNAGTLTPTAALTALVTAWAGDCRATVDAGAHMLPAMLMWPARKRSDILISNGLSTMGYALPAAIGAALLEPGRRVVALTGDGGLLMCLGELATLARERLDVCVVVFDDRSLSLIKLKQERRGPTVGVDLGAVDWPVAAASVGIPGFAVETLDLLQARIAQLATVRGPSLLAIRIESSDYRDLLSAIRG